MSFDFFLNAMLLLMLLTSAVLICLRQRLFPIVIMGAIYSFLSAAIFMVLDAVDVAFTEAAVGAGISTVLYLGTLALIGKKVHAHQPPKFDAKAFAVCLVCGGVLLYATQDMPAFGDPDAPVHQHVAKRYIEDSAQEVGPPNIVTSVLASYRGYDTLGEVGVVFSAAIGVLLLLGSGRVKKRSVDDQRANEDEHEL